MTTLPLSADTYIRVGTPNTNFSSESFMALGVGGVTRALVRFDTAAALAAIAPATQVAAAALELPVSSNGAPAGQAQAFELRRLLVPWTETGATWSCAIDGDLTNSTPDCSGVTQWSMGTASSAPAAPGPRRAPP